MADPNQVLRQIEELLSLFLSPDNAARRSAEAAYNNMKSQPDTLGMGLLHCARYSQRIEVRNAAEITLL